MVYAINCDVLNLGLFGGKLWFVEQKKGFGYNTKYPKMRCDQKTYFLKSKDIVKKPVIF
jgi:hypothetical protein